MIDAATLSAGALLGLILYARGYRHGHLDGHDTGYAEASIESAEHIRDAFDQGHASAFDAMRAANAAAKLSPRERKVRMGLDHVTTQREAGRTGRQ